MHDLAFPLDAAVDPHHAGRENDPTLPLIERRPDYEIGDARLVLDCDEHHSLRRAGLLPHEHEPGGLKPSPVAGLYGLSASDEASAAEFFAQETDGMAAQGQPGVAVIFDNFAGCR